MVALCCDSGMVALRRDSGVAAHNAAYPEEWERFLGSTSGLLDRVRAL
jgi:hypothetical protein